MTELRGFGSALIFLLALGSWPAGAQESADPVEEFLDEIQVEDFVLTTTKDLVEICLVPAEDPLADLAVGVCLGYVAAALHTHGEVIAVLAEAGSKRNLAKEGAKKGAAWGAAGGAIFAFLAGGDLGDIATSAGAGAARYAAAGAIAGGIYGTDPAKATACLPEDATRIDVAIAFLEYTDANRRSLVNPPMTEMLAAMKDTWPCPTRRELRRMRKGK